MLGFKGGGRFEGLEVLKLHYFHYCDEPRGRKKASGRHASISRTCMVMASVFVHEVTLSTAFG